MSWSVTHGDSLEWLRTLHTGSVDLVVTDPPYGINTKSDGLGKLSPWADLCNSAFWYAAWFKECRRVLRDTGAMWACANWRSFVTYQKAACDIGWSVESVLIWDKAWIGPGGHRGLRPRYELVLLFAMPGFVVPDRGTPDILVAKWAARKPHGHPAEKPVEVPRFAINASGRPAGAVVVDPFTGSGTTGEAALSLGCDFLGCELDARWVAVARERCARVANAHRSVRIDALMLDGFR